MRKPRKVYRVKLLWLDGRITYTQPSTNKREAERTMRLFRDVALIDRVALEPSYERP